MEIISTKENLRKKQAGDHGYFTQIAKDIIKSGTPGECKEVHNASEGELKTIRTLIYRFAPKGSVEIWLSKGCIKVYFL